MTENGWYVIYALREILRLKYEQGLLQARLDIPPHA